MNPTALQLIGHMRHLTGLKLQGSTGWVECGGATTTLQDPFRELRCVFWVGGGAVVAWVLGVARGRARGVFSDCLPMH